MTTPHQAVHEIAVLAKSLRQQVAESHSSHANRGRRKGFGGATPRDTQLHDNLSSLLEWVDQLEGTMATEKPDPAAPTVYPEPAATVDCAQILDALDGAMAGWKSKISMAYAEGASQEMSDHLKRAQQLMESLCEREERLEVQRQRLEQNLADVLQREARTARQRVSIAQSLRAQRAEMRLEVEQLRQERNEQIRQELASELERRHSHDDQELEELRRERDSLRKEREGMHDERNDLRSERESLHREMESLRNELRQTQERLAWMSQPDQDQADRQQGLLLELEEQLAQANAELAQLQEQLQSQSETPLLIEAQAETIAELKKELADSHQQLQDLNRQNSDLAAAVAKHQVLTSGNTPHVSFQQESLSWEERKRLIMKQLEEECDSEEVLSDQQVERHLEIEQVLQSTQLEIEKRDREIAELQTIVEQQSDTRQGVAIGAAAFAQAFDNDEMIQQERLKLKEIQREWEEKLRQAEIDVPLERAKLARERLQLELELENTRREQAQTDKEPEKAKKRKWLEHLGLRDENRAEH